MISSMIEVCGLHLDNSHAIPSVSETKRAANMQHFLKWLFVTGFCSQLMYIMPHPCVLSLEKLSNTLLLMPAFRKEAEKEPSVVLPCIVACMSRPCVFTAA